MATNEYNPEQQTGMRSELDEPRRTSESTEFDQSKSAGERGEGGEGGYGGVSESEPPHHKIHTDDEPLPKPTSGTYDDEKFSTPSATGAGGNYGDDSTEKFQDSRSEEPQTGAYDETPETRSRGFGGEEKPSGGYSDPSSAFPGAPVDRTTEEPGYGQDTKAAAVPMSTGPGPESPTPKKEGFVQKLKEKLPGHKTSTPTDTMEDETATETGTPKKGLMTKIKEKLPGHHSPTTPPTDTTTESKSVSL